MAREGSVVNEKASGPNFEWRYQKRVRSHSKSFGKQIELEYITGNGLVGWLTFVTFFFFSP